MTAQTKTEIAEVDAAEPTQHATSLTLAMDPNAMDKMLRVAEIMAAGRATVPKHLQNNVPDCLAVTMQAMTWGMSPFVVAQKTHLVNGTLGYEAQLVNAVVQASGAITGRFHYEYEGKSPNLLCRVGAVLRGETEITWGNWLNEKDVTTKNSPLWKTNPAQQLGYLQVKNWSRLFSPGSIMGVYTPDEIETFKPPRNMGAAEVMEAAASPALIAAAEAAASNGMAGYQEFWKTASKEDRKLLAGEHERLKAMASAVDKARTVEQPAAPAAAASEKGQVTADQVLAKINAATNEDELYVAADWINAITDNAEVEKLNARFDERLAELRG
jgi:nitrogen regulatory protein PII-like uncharacterized protein